MLTTFVFTKRKIFSVLNSFYDPAGLISAYLIKFKIKMREVTRVTELDGDTPIPEKLQISWRKMVREIVLADSVVFFRSVRPAASIGRPELIGYWDGSESAYAAVVYIRWLSGEDPANPVWVSSLLTSKARVTPVAGITAPRTELNGFVVLSRIMELVLSSLNEKPARITLIGDSECTISAYESRTASLAPYFSNRINEVEDKIQLWGRKYDQDEMEETDMDTLLDLDGDTLIDNLFHTPGPLNPADLATRGAADISDIQTGSVWQDGPGYLRESRDRWPVSREFRRSVPSNEKRSKFYESVNVAGVRSAQTTNRLYQIMEYSTSWIKVKGIMARTIRALVRQSRGSITDRLTVEDYARADQLMAVMAMKETVEMTSNSDLSGLAPFWEGCVAYTRGRMGPSMKKLLGPDKLMILSPKSRLAVLIMTQSHEEDHRRDGGDTLFRLRKFAWVVRGRRLADRIMKNCGWCKSQMKETLTQQIGNLPEKKFSIPCRPFTHICVDLAGPFEVEAMNNARTKLKVYPILFCCINIGALAIYVAAGASTSCFLTQYDHFTADHGTPKFVYSDRGTNLT